VLVEVARRLTHCIREADTVSRLGGDEFVVLLENLDAENDGAAIEAKSVAAKILAEFSRPFVLEDREYHCSASIGIALFAGRQATQESVLSRADTAMYDAKRGGKNAYRFFDPAMQKVLEQRMNMEAALRQAIANRQFELFYQIQVDRRRSFDLLAASATRAGVAAGIHSGRGRNRDDFGHRALGFGDRLCPDQELGEWNAYPRSEDCGQCQR
jgi:predicted signal transduction protein with EAL and GGDEF domain